LKSVRDEPAGHEMTQVVNAPGMIRNAGGLRNLSGEARCADAVPLTAASMSAAAAVSVTIFMHSPPSGGGDAIGRSNPLTD
jgi:hypothetical protein